MIASSLVTKGIRKEKMGGIMERFSFASIIYNLIYAFIFWLNCERSVGFSGTLIGNYRFLNLS